MTFKESPLKVSPLIKFSRWALLILGIFYGSSKQKILSVREDKLRKVQEEQRKIKEEVIQAEKAKRAAAEMEMLEEIFRGTPSEDDEDKD